MKIILCGEIKMTHMIVIEIKDNEEVSIEGYSILKSELKQKILKYLIERQ